MKMMMFLTAMTSMLSMKTKTPMIMVMVIIFQTLMLCLMIWLNTSSWFSFILFLIFMGGLMVLFIYICSLAPNEKNLVFFSVMEVIMLMVATILIILFINSTKIVFMEMDFKSMIFKMINTNMKFIILSTMFYLLLTLIVVVKMSNLKMGSIRSLSK